jgi:uronate dehydrogenase
MTTVLVTGATGEVARGVLPLLEGDFDLRLLSLDPPGDDPRRIQADLLDWAALARAMNGVDAVLHLAVASGHSGVYEDDTFNDLRFDINVKGTYHVFEAARRVRVPRVVYVSSLMASWGRALPLADYRDPPLVPGDVEALPAGTYALTKALGERIAAHYALQSDMMVIKKAYGGRQFDIRRPARAKYPMEVIALRIAGPLDVDDPNFRARPVRPQQVPFPDLAQAFARALTVPLRRYEVVTIVGMSSRQLWDLGPAMRVLGYQPRYYLDDLGVTFADPFAVEAH